MFTDIEGSTRLWQLYESSMADAVEDQLAMLRRATEQQGGELYKVVGDAIQAVFPTAAAALAASLEAQLTLTKQGWDDVGQLRVRMALHTGVVRKFPGDWRGAPLNRAARLVAAAWGGQLLVSGATAELLEGLLPDGVGLDYLGEHHLRDLDLPERVFQVTHPSLPAEFPPLRTIDAAKSNLPEQLTAFVGRIGEVEEIQKLLRTARLVTVIGVGGVGKTRLALQAATSVLNDHSDGVWLVDLASLTAPELVVAQLATALGIRERAGEALLETVQDFIRNRKLLLVLDNCEHLVEAVGQLANALLQRAGSLHILATSRVPLGIPGEIVYRLDPLPTPSVDGSFQAILANDAVQLFMERAKAADRGVQFTSDSIQAIAEICRRLDGIPLAIQMAAGRTRSMSPNQIARQLDRRFEILADRQTVALPHHRTLEATLDWSHQLLDETARILFRRLAVFSGTFDLERVKGVCSGDGLDEVEVLDALSELVDHSLLVAERFDGEHRYRMLQTVRQYARDRLEATAEASSIGNRHATYFAALAERVKSEVHPRNESRPWSADESFTPDLDDYRTSMAWFAEHDPIAGMRLGNLMVWVWVALGRPGEGCLLLEAVLSADEAGHHSHERIAATRAAGLLRWEQGDPTRAETWWKESLELAQALGDEFGIARAANNLANAADEAGDTRRALAYSKIALNAAEHCGLRDLELILVANLATYEGSLGHLDVALLTGERALQLAQEEDDEVQEGWIRANQASTLMCLGRMDEAESEGRIAVEMLRHHGDRYFVTSALSTLAVLLLRSGRHAEGEALALEAAGHAERYLRSDAPDALKALAMAAVERGWHELAATMYAVARSNGRRPEAVDPEWSLHQPALDRAAKSLGAEFETTWRRGQSLSLDDAFELVRKAWPAL